MGAKPKLGTQSWEAAALRIDLFAGDKEAPYEHLLSDKFVRVRKSHKCPDCQERMTPGSLARHVKAIDDGMIVEFRICAACLDAMLLASFEGDSSAMEARLTQGRYRAAQLED